MYYYTYFGIVKVVFIIRYVHVKIGLFFGSYIAIFFF
jgi:hypothetical protein